MIRRLAAVLPLALLLAPALHTASTPPTSWIAVTSSQVVYLTWTDRAGELTGTAQVTKVTGVAPTLATSSDGIPVAGSEADGKVTLRFGGSILGVTRSGSISGSAIVLESASSGGVSTSRFVPGGAATYNHAVGALRHQLAARNARAITRIAAARVQQVFRSLPSAMRAVHRSEAATKTALTALSRAWAAQRTASPVAGRTCLTAEEYDAASDAYTATGSALSEAHSATSDLALAVETLGMTPSALNGHKTSTFSPNQRTLLKRSIALDVAAGRVSDAATASISMTAGAAKTLMKTATELSICDDPATDNTSSDQDATDS